MAEILIGGDICPINRNLPYFLAGDAAAIFNDLLPDFEQADLSIVNLECPLIEKPSPIHKSGPVLGAEQKAVNGLRNASIKVVNLANNHILDHGPEGLLSTMNACEEAGIATVGAGANLQQAGQMLVKNVSGVRVGILAYAEREFSIAGSDDPGANPLDVARFIRSIRHYNKEFDYLIILFHGGVEHYPLPTPRVQDMCRLMIEEGADAVICQHSHCPGCYEEYNEGHIVYGQGNLIFDRYPHRSSNFYCGYLVKLSIRRDFSADLSIVPFHQSEARAGARKMGMLDTQNFVENLKKESAKIRDPAFVVEAWKETCRKKKSTCFSTLRGHSRLLRYANRVIPFAHKLYTLQNLLNLHNLIRCESHREILETVLYEMRHEDEKGV